MRRVHPLTDAHTAGVIHSLRERQATKVRDDYWSGWLGPSVPEDV